MHGSWLGPSSRGCGAQKRLPTPFLFLVTGLLLAAMDQGNCAAQTLSRDKIDAMWEELLQKEQYRAVQYMNHRYSTPTTDLLLVNEKKIVVQEGREGYLGGLWGLSEGGGLEIRGQLEAEIPIRAGLLQLYSKAIIKWSPGFAFLWMPGYDPKQYPLWEFRLLMRNQTHRQQVQFLKSLTLATGDILPTFYEDGTSVKELIGQRIPRGELRYEESSKTVTIQILGVHHPLAVEVQLSQVIPATQEKHK